LACCGSCSRGTSLAGGRGGSAGEQECDQVGHVGDVNHPIRVDIGFLEARGFRPAAEEVADQVGHVGDVGGLVVVAVDVAPHADTAAGAGDVDVAAFVLREEVLGSFGRKSRAVFDIALSDGDGINGGELVADTGAEAQVHGAEPAGAGGNDGFGHDDNIEADPVVHDGGALDGDVGDP